MGPAPSALWGVPPTPPLQLEDPSLKPQPFPPRPLLPSSPHPLDPFCNALGGGGLGWCGGGVLGRRGWRGRALQAALGARPTSGSTRNKGDLFFADVRVRFVEIASRIGRRSFQVTELIIISELHQGEPLSVGQLSVVVP